VPWLEELGERAAAGKRAPEVRIRRGHPVAVATEVELVDHELVEQADHVGAGADQVARIGERLLERAGTAELLASLEHQRGASGAGEVGGRGEAVVTPADHDRVPVAGGELTKGRRQPDPAEHSGDVDGAHRGGPHYSRNRPLAHRAHRIGLAGPVLRAQG